MAKITWDAVGERVGEGGVKNGVLYTIGETGAYGSGVPWNGLIGVSESPTGAESSPFYADDMKYLDIATLEEFGGSIEAYTYPDEFKPCIGELELKTGVSVTQQTRTMFGFVYKTTMVNDAKGMDFGYKLHLIYGAKAGVSEVARATLNENPDLVTFNWNITTTPVTVTGGKPTSHLIIDTTKLAEEETASTKLQTLEDQLFGKDDDDDEIIPNLPLPDAVAAMFA